jgi:hypothetical protein
VGWGGVLHHKCSNMTNHNTVCMQSVQWAHLPVIQPMLHPHASVHLHDLYRQVRLQGLQVLRLQVRGEALLEDATRIGQCKWS